VQINAIAPGPVDGERLKGVGSRPGLFERRGRLILENKRLNAVHAAVVKALRCGQRVEALLSRLATNDVAAMAMDGDALCELAVARHKDRTDDCTWGSYLITEAIAERLTHRLRMGGAAEQFAVSPDVPKGSDRSGARFALANFVKTSLHAFTAALAVENERLVHDVPVNQINLTRRARSKEPRDQAEHQ
jgi:malonyl-CoA reductase/3-hydroxypropionate dehydrogenase (NADP+)